MYRALTNNHNYNIVKSDSYSSDETNEKIIIESSPCISHTFDSLPSISQTIESTINEPVKMQHPYVPINETPLESHGSQINLSSFFDKDISKKNLEMYKLIKNHIERLDDKITLQRSDIIKLEDHILTLQIDIKGLLLICSNFKLNQDINVVTETAPKPKSSIIKAPTSTTSTTSATKPESIKRFK